jgi:hypothetical protein
MLRRTSSTVILLALILGASGCIVYDRDDGRRHRYDRYDRYDRGDRRYGDADRDRDCWRRGDDWVCRER